MKKNVSMTNACIKDWIRLYTGIRESMIKYVLYSITLTQDLSKNKRYDLCFIMLCKTDKTSVLGQCFFFVHFCSLCFGEAVNSQLLPLWPSLVMLPWAETELCFLLEGANSGTVNSVLIGHDVYTIITEESCWSYFLLLYVWSMYRKPKWYWLTAPLT